MVEGVGVGVQELDKVPLSSIHKVPNLDRVGSSPKRTNPPGTFHMHVYILPELTQKSNDIQLDIYSGTGVRR